MLQHGDTVVCYGRGIAGHTIRKWLSIRYFWKMVRNGFRTPSHVAFLSEYDVDAQNRKLLLFESTTLSDSPDAITGKERGGVQAHHFSDWLAQYRGRVDLYQTVVLQRSTGRSKMRDYVAQVHRDSIEYDLAQAVGSGIGFIRNTEDGSRLFCSEFWTFAMQKGGSIGTHVNCSEVNPLDVPFFPCIKFVRRLK